MCRETGCEWVARKEADIVICAILAQVGLKVATADEHGEASRVGLACFLAVGSWTGFGTFVSG